MVEEHTSRKLQGYENIHVEDSFLITLKSLPLAEVSFHFNLQLCKNVFEWLLSLLELHCAPHLSAGGLNLLQIFKTEGGRCLTGGGLVGKKRVTFLR